MKTDKEFIDTSQLPTKLPARIWIYFYRMALKSLPTIDCCSTAGCSSCNQAIEYNYIASISPHYEHCQIVFEWDTARQNVQHRWIAYSTTRTTGARFMTVQYKNSKWIKVALQGTDGCNDYAVNARRVIYNWARDNDCARFNTCGYFWNFLPCINHFNCLQYSSPTSFFCAEHVANALLLLHYESSDYTIIPKRETPDTLFRYLTVHIGCQAFPITIERQLTLTKLGMYEPPL